MRTMLILAVLALGLGGCSLLDMATGVNYADGTRDASGGPVASAAPIVNAIIPGGGMLLTSLGGLYAAFRLKKWKDLAVSTFDVIESASAAGKSVKEAKAELAVAHEEKGVLGIAEKIAAKYDS